MINSYRDLNVWQASMELVQRVYSLTRAFPKVEQFGLAHQLQRSAVSIPSNIAEGHARGSTREYLRFVSIARGSLAEAETQLILAGRLEYAASEVVDAVLIEADEISRMLRRLQQSLERKGSR